MILDTWTTGSQVVSPFMNRGGIRERYLDIEMVILYIEKFLRGPFMDPNTVHGGTMVTYLN